MECIKHWIDDLRWCELLGNTYEFHFSHRAIFLNKNLKMKNTHPIQMNLNQKAKSHRLYIGLNSTIRWGALHRGTEERLCTWFDFDTRTLLAFTDPACGHCEQGTGSQSEPGFLDLKIICSALVQWIAAIGYPLRAAHALPLRQVLQVIWIRSLNGYRLHMGLLPD